MKPLALALLLTYLGGGFLTNAYCQTYRWEAWAGPINPEKRDRYLSGFNEIKRKDSAKTKLLAATAAWPAYWASCAAFWIVSHTVEIKPHAPYC